MFSTNTTADTNPIFDTTNISDILKHHENFKACFFDLDNTVMEPHDDHEELGSDQWFVKFIEYASKVDLEKDDKAVDLVLSIYHAVHHHINVKPVDDEVVTVIKSLQENGIPVFALTARGAEIKEPTLRQLDSIGIHFSRNWPDENVSLDETNKKNPPIFHHGVIFCSGNDKGKTLQQFFDKHAFYPEKVGMCDDKLKYVEASKQTVTSYGGKHVGFRYGKLDEKVKKFNMHNATIKLLELKKKLPDDARLSMKKLNVKSITANSQDVNAKTTPLLSHSVFKDNSQTATVVTTETTEKRTFVNNTQ